MTVIEIEVINQDESGDLSNEKWPDARIDLVVEEVMRRR